jgi:endonuclease YncB( thermonuclease family)
LSEGAVFKLLRKVIIGVLVLIVGTVAYHYLGNPGYRRRLAHSAEEIKERIQDDKRYAWTGTAVVLDAVKGDKLRVDTEANHNVTVRLAGIDAPELPPDHFHKGQPFAEESRDLLTRLTKGKAVEMAILGTDAEKRPLVLLTLDGVLINAKIAEAGLAEVGGELMAAIPAKQRHLIEDAELGAKVEARGIWSLTNYVRPIEFRIREKIALRPHYGTD